MSEFVFVTGNEHKARYVAAWLGQDIEQQKLDLDEIQSLDSRHIVEHKARQAYEKIGRAALVEDVSLCFAALGRLPGPFIKWFEEELSNERLCQLASALGDRRATATVLYGLFDGTTMRYFEGDMRGTIADEPRGTGGFGFDSIFINDGQPLTRAEMDEATYEATSYRTVALNKLKDFVRAGA